MSNEVSYIPNEIANAAVDEFGNRKPVTRAHNIYDDGKQQWQDNLNRAILEEKNHSAADFSGMGRVVLQKNIVDISGVSHNWLTQAMMQKPNTIYVIQYDFEIDPAITNGTAAVSTDNVSQAVNPAYTNALAAYNEAHDAWIAADNAYSNNPNETTLAAKNAAYAVLQDVQAALDDNPQYYYYASTPISVAKGRRITIPAGCVLLNETLNGVVSFDVAPADTTVYIGGKEAGSRSYTIQYVITVPSSCVIKFEGGSISDGIMVGNNTYLVYERGLAEVMPNVTREGTFVYNNTLSADEESLTEQGNIIKIKDTGVQGKHLNYNVVDDEDIHLTSANKLQFKDRGTTDGMGRIILRKGSSFASQLTQTNTIYEIRYDFDLGGTSIALPENCILDFEGGSLRNGTLNGQLHTLDEYLDVKNIGIVYNSSANANSNVAKLSILSGITNEVKLKISDTLYLGSGSASIRELSIDGCGCDIHLNGFDGFNVDKTAKIFNCNVYASTTESNRLFVITDTANISDVDIENNYFTGDLRVLTGQNECTAEVDRYINSIMIFNNKFENIAFVKSGSCVIFRLVDVGVNRLYLYNNTVHNFFGSFYSDHADNTLNEYVDLYQATIGYSRVISNNIVYNDIDYRPFERFVGVYPMYFSFVTCKRGSAVFENNQITNILGADTDDQNHISTFSFYLSCDKLYVRNNYIKNTFNLTCLAGWGNCVFKCKNAYGHLPNAERVFENNTVIYEDLSIVFTGYDCSKGYASIIPDTGIHDVTIIKNNYISLYSHFNPVGTTLLSRYTSFCYNIIKIGVSAIGNNSSGLFNLQNAQGEDSYCFVARNNEISVESKSNINEHTGILLDRSTSARVELSNNRCKNMGLYVLYDNSTPPASMKIFNNSITVSNDMTRQNDVICNAAVAKAVSRGNEVYNMGANTLYARVCGIPGTYSIIGGLTYANSQIFYIGGWLSDGTYTAIAKIRKRNSGIYSMVQLNYTVQNNAVSQISFIDKDGNVQTESGDNSSTQMKNFGTDTTQKIYAAKSKNGIAAAISDIDVRVEVNEVSSITDLMSTSEEFDAYFNSLIGL